MEINEKEITQPMIDNKITFINLLLSVGHKNIPNLIKYLEIDNDFFIAPASTKFHGSYPGGLLEHSLEVYYQLKTLLDSNWLIPDIEYHPNSIILTALLHDVCKANFYTVSKRNVKDDETGKWHKENYYAVDDKLPLGHGEKSVIIIQRFLPLSVEETMAIRWHMAGFDSSASTFIGLSALSKAMSEYPLITLLHIADLASINLIPKEGV